MDEQFPEPEPYESDTRDAEPRERLTDLDIKLATVGEPKVWFLNL